MLSVRLDEATRKLLDRLARTQKVSRSEVVRRAIHSLSQDDPAAGEANPYADIRHLIGKVRGGPGDLSEQTGKRFREALRAKQDRR